MSTASEALAALACIEARLLAYMAEAIGEDAQVVAIDEYSDALARWEGEGGTVLPAREPQ
jgi:hypothetical protein